MAKRAALSNHPRQACRHCIHSTVPRPLSPSAGILTILASIVASSNAHPLDCQSPPPHFLCPSIDNQHDDVTDRANLPGPSSYAHSPVVPTPRPRPRAKRAIPESYSQGDDGRWRKITEWTFYGSTVCLCNDDTTPTAAAALNATSALDPDALPTGWNSSNSPATRTVFILMFSLILTCVISVFIVGSICWRKRRKSKADKDPEKKGSKTKGLKDEGPSTSSRIKSRLWAKASARWKDNVKHSARRRRNTRLTAVTSQLNDSSIYLSRSPSPTRTLQASISSRSPTPSPSPPLGHDSSDVDVDDSGSLASHESNANNLATSSPYLSPTSPPAYHGDATNPSNAPAIQNATSSQDSAGSPDADVSPPPLHNKPSPLGEEEPQYTLPLHVAHVATDDKAVLQSIVIMGSEPPVDEDPAGGSCDVPISAPILFDDDDQSFSHDTELSPSDGARPSMFPAPPEPPPTSKGKMAALELYDYDDLNVEPPTEPSAPPFESSGVDCSGPSAPPPAELMMPEADELDVQDGAFSGENGAVGSNLPTRPPSQDTSLSGGGLQSELLPRYQP